MHGGRQLERPGHAAQSGDATPLADACVADACSTCGGYIQLEQRSGCAEGAGKVVDVEDTSDEGPNGVDDEEDGEDEDRDGTACVGHTLGLGCHDGDGLPLYRLPRLHRVPALLMMWVGDLLLVVALLGGITLSRLGTLLMRVLSVLLRIGHEHSLYGSGTFVEVEA